MGDKFKLVLKIEERFNAGNAQRKVFGKIKGRPNKNIEVIHHSGVKGMKWGVRNGPPYPIKNKGKVVKAQSTLKNADGKDIISVNHVELTGKPNSITQIQRKNGGIDRNYYDSSGRQIKQISNHNHGQPKHHPYGKYGEHVHDYIYDISGKLRGRPVRELTQNERRENGDIL